MQDEIEEIDKIVNFLETKKLTISADLHELSEILQFKTKDSNFEWIGILLAKLIEKLREMLKPKSDKSIDNPKSKNKISSLSKKS